MAGRIIVSGGGKLRTFSLSRLAAGEGTPLPGSGALCAGRDCIYAASETERAVYRLDAKTLLPSGVFSGGPGMSALCLSGDGERLFVLLSDADSVLMLSAQSGAPMMLARVGACPQSMRLDDTGNHLVIAGGRDGCVYILCSRTLRLLERCALRGFLMDASKRGGRVRAMKRCGALENVPGKLIAGPGVTLMLDGLRERLYIAHDVRKNWRFVCSGARDAAIVWDKEECDRA